MCVFAKDGSDGLDPPMLQMSDLEEFRDDSRDKTGAEKQDQTDPDPDKAVYRVVYAGYLIYDAHT